MASIILQWQEKLLRNKQTNRRKQEISGTINITIKQC